MNKYMYTSLACAIIFLLACIGIRYKDRLLPILAPESAQSQSDKAPSPPEEVLKMISEQAEKHQAKTDTPATPPPDPIIKGPVLALSGIKNFVKNPSANNGTKHWETMKNVTVEPAKYKNPAFTLRNNGRIKQKIKLINANMHYIVVGTCGSASEINSDQSDPTGLPLVRIYFEDRFDKSHTDESTEVIMTRIKRNGWGQIGLVKQIPKDTLYLHLELYQARGKSALKDKTTQFDDVCVSIARTKEAGIKMLNSYIAQAQAFNR